MLKFGFIVIGATMVGSYSDSPAKSYTLTENTSSECKLIFEEVTAISANELWALDYEVMLQSPNGPLMRVFFHANYRHSELQLRRKWEAFLLFGQRLKNDKVKAYRILSNEGATLGRIGLAIEGAEYDFQVNVNRDGCHGETGSDSYFLKVNDDSVTINAAPTDR